MSDKVVTPVDPENPPILTGDEAISLITEIKDDLIPAAQVMFESQRKAAVDHAAYSKVQGEADDATNSLLVRQEQERSDLAATNAAKVDEAHRTWVESDVKKKNAEELFIKEMNYVSKKAGGDPNAIDPTPTVDPVPVTPIDPVPVDPVPVDPTPVVPPAPVPTMQKFVGGGGK